MSNSNPSLNIKILSLLSKTDDFKRNDQSMFAEYFGKQDKLKRLDIKFNCGRKLIRDNLKKIEDVYIIHYPGANKPYDIKSKRLNYGCYTYKYWHQIKRKIDGQNIFIIFIKNIFYSRIFSYLRSNYFQKFF